VKSLAEGGLDFEDAASVFSVTTLTLLDDRRDYGEPGSKPTGFSVAIW
jgi:hypothetical protein